MATAEDWWRPEFGDYEEIRREADRLAGIAHIDGVHWRLHPTPPADHACWAQTWQPHFAGRLWLERCPCGAWRHRPADEPFDQSTPWKSVNSRAERCAPSPSLIMRALLSLRRKGRPT